MHVLPICGRNGAADPEDSRNFITRRGDKLFDGDQPFRFISFNIPNLLVIEDAFAFTQPNPWRWPDEFEIEDALESVRQMGGQVVRTYVLSVHREGSDMGESVHVLAPGRIQRRRLSALDKVLEVAHRKGIRVIIPFVDQAKWMGRHGEYAAFRGKQADDFWTDPQDHRRFQGDDRICAHPQEHLHRLAVSRRSADLRLGNRQRNRRHARLDARNRGLHQTARHESSGDRRQVAARRLPVELDDPNVDVITTHHYPLGDDPTSSAAIREPTPPRRARSRTFVGEFGFVEMPHIASAISTR